MRIRNKPWAKEELNASKFYIQNPEKLKGKWKDKFKKSNNPIHLELGCGKGYFVKKAGFKNPEINYIAIDLIDAMLGVANRNITEEFDGKEVANILLTRYDIEEINNILDKQDIDGDKLNDDNIDNLNINQINNSTDENSNL